MAFNKVSKSSAGGQSWRKEPSVRMSAYKRQDDSMKQSVAFFINEALIEAIGWKLESPTRGDPKRRITYIDLHEGTGDDIGYLLLSPAENKEKGYVFGVSKAEARTFSLNITIARLRHYVLSPDLPELCDVEFTYAAEDKTILIECPSWLRFNPLSVPQERTPSKPEVKTAQTKLPNKKREVDIEIEGSTPSGLSRAERRVIGHKIARHLR